MRIFLFISIILQVFTTLIFSISQSYAANENMDIRITKDSSFYNWEVYEVSHKDSQQNSCYIISKPVKSDSNYKNRRAPHFMITHFQKDGIEEVSNYSGFEYKNGGEVLISTDGMRFKLGAKGDLAWAKNVEDDLEIIQEMLIDHNIKVRSDSAFGAYAIDEYSLRGIARAYARMRRICDVF